MPSTAQVYLKKSRARHVREHGEHLISPLDPAEPAGAAGDALGDFLFTRGQVLTAVLPLLLSEVARETLAAALWMRRGGATAWALGGRSGARWGRRQPEAPRRRPFLE